MFVISVQIPSKHDVLSFMRVVEGELDRAVHGGEASLAPLILHGVSDAVAQLCSRIDRMVYTSKAAYMYVPVTEKNRKSSLSSSSLSSSLSPLSNSSDSAGGTAELTPTLEQNHNLQLLQLVAKLHDAMKRLPSSVFCDGEGRGGNAITKASCVEAIKPALRSLEGLGKIKLLRPATAAMARTLEQSIASIHLEHFGGSGSEGRPQGGAIAAVNNEESVRYPVGSLKKVATPNLPTVESGMGGSIYLVHFQEDLRRLSRGHLAKFPTDSGIVKKALAELAARLIRSYVSHVALVRPLSQAGRTRLTQDLAIFEMALSQSLAEVSELGRSYAELQALRQALFLESDAEPTTAFLKAVSRKARLADERWTDNGEKGSGIHFLLLTKVELFILVALLICNHLVLRLWNMFLQISG